MQIQRFKLFNRWSWKWSETDLSLIEESTIPGPPEASRCGSFIPSEFSATLGHIEYLNEPDAERQAAAMMSPSLANKLRLTLSGALKEGRRNEMRMCCCYGARGIFTAHERCWYCWLKETSGNFGEGEGWTTSASHITLVCVCVCVGIQTAAWRWEDIKKRSLTMKRSQK